MIKHRDIIAKYTIYVLLIVLIHLVQTCFNLSIYGYSLNILPTVFLAVSFLDDLPISIVLAIFSGIITDMNFFRYVGINSFLFIIIAISIHFLSKYFFAKNITTNAMFVSISLLCYKLVLYVYYYFLVSKTPFLLYFKIISAEILMATLLSFIPFLIVKILNKPKDTGE